MCEKQEYGEAQGSWGGDPNPQQQQQHQHHQHQQKSSHSPTMGPTLPIPSENIDDSDGLR